MHDKNESRFRLTVTEGQARAIVNALDLYTRLGLGQIEELAEVIRLGTIPLRRDAGAGTRQNVDGNRITGVEEHLYAIKDLLGYPSSGSHGIGHPDNHISVTRCYEAGKILLQAIAIAREPDPSLRTVDYDGLTVRYTNDPAAEVEEVVMIPVLDSF